MSMLNDKGQMGGSKFLSTFLPPPLPPPHSLPSCSTTSPRCSRWTCLWRGSSRTRTWPTSALSGSATTRTTASSPFSSLSASASLTCPSAILKSTKVRCLCAGLTFRCPKEYKGKVSVCRSPFPLSQRVQR